MKKLIKINLTFVLLISASTLIFAQEYKSSRLTISAGISRGLFLSFEPSLRVDDKFSIHCRGEIGAVDGLSVISSLSIAGQYYYSKKHVTPKFRPFLGVGFGVFSYTPFTLDFFGGQTSVNGSQIGCFPRIGFDSRHFTFAIDANLVPDFTEKFVNYPTTTINYIKGTYITVKLGLTLGGGKKINEDEK